MENIGVPSFWKKWRER